MQGREAFVFLGTSIIGKEHWPEKMLDVRLSKLLFFMISFTRSSISLHMGIKLFQLSLSNWRVSVTFELPYFDAARLCWMGSQLCISPSFFFPCHYFFFFKKQLSGDLWSLSTRAVSCPWTKLFTCKHYCKTFLFNQVYIFPLVIVTFTHKVLTVPFIGMILQAPSHWHHIVWLPFHSRSASRWDDW